MRGAATAGMMKVAMNCAGTVPRFRAMCTCSACSLSGQAEHRLPLWTTLSGSVRHGFQAGS